MRIVLRTIRHDDQRYETVGDWYVDRGILNVNVSDLKDQRYNHLVMVHELVEAILCFHRKIDEQEVTDFDMAYESQRKENDYSEPGDSPVAPYRAEHFTATTIERILAEALEVKWHEYEEAVNSLSL